MLRFTKRAVLRVASLCALVLLAACATAPEVADVEVERALPKSSDLFWQHISEDEPSDWFYPLNVGPEALDWRLALIDSAHSSVDMESFLWTPDEGGLRILSHLLAAADRGARVRLLLDDSFTPHEDLVLHDVDLHPNIEVRIYNPYHVRPASALARTLVSVGDFSRLNHRLHNKTLVVDGWAASVGGRNLADEYFGLHDEYNFRDMEVLTMGASVATASRHFDAFWNSGWAFPVGQLVQPPENSQGLDGVRDMLRESRGALLIRDEGDLERRWREVAESAFPGTALFVADRPPHEDPALAAEAPRQVAGFVVDMLFQARSDVVLVSAYLVPTEELLQAIRELGERDVRVRILTNSLRSNNHLSAHAAYRGYIRDLVEHGAELYELRRDATDRNLYMREPVADKHLGLHAKFMLIDDQRVFVGSSNLDQRSLNLNTEVGLMIDSRELNRRLRDAIAVDFEPRNAWSVGLDSEGELVWTGEAGERYSEPPADSLFQQLEDWFVGLLPIDAQM